MHFWECEFIFWRKKDWLKNKINNIAYLQDGWMDALMDGWMDGCMDGWMHACIDGWMDGWMDACMDTWMHGLMDGWIIRKKDKHVTPKLTQNTNSEYYQ